MKSLYIDTSSKYLYTGIVDKKILVEEKILLEQNLSRDTLVYIEKMFKNNNLSIDEVEKIIVVNGPGSFTGIRIGITIAKVIAWAKKINISTCSSLLAMAISNNTLKIKVPIIDARHNYLFAAIYNEKNEELLKPQYIHVDQLKEELKKYNDYELISNDNIETFENISKYEPNIEKIVDFTKDFENINPHSVNPEYLKLSSVEEQKQ